MSDKKYPHIGKSVLTMLVYIAYGNESFYCIDSAKFSDDIYEDNLKNITREYLTNTYGKCESQEHADFICELAENAGFESNHNFKDGEYFYISKTKYGFGSERFCKLDGAKLIHLPLPPKENKMPEVKPVKPIYTKEMLEHGELPPVGSFVEKYTDSKPFKARTHEDYSMPDAWPKGSKLEVIAHTKICGKLLPVVKFDNWVSAIMLREIKPIPTIEDEMNKILSNHYDNGGMDEDLIKKFLEKYNITPKGE